METELKKDGSGTGEMKLTISPKVTEIMARYEGISDMPATDITHMANLDEDELKAVASKAHVKIKNFKSEVRDGRKTVSFKMEFKTLEDYSWVLGYVMDDTGGGFRCLRRRRRAADIQGSHVRFFGPGSRPTGGRGTDPIPAKKPWKSTWR